MPLRDVADRLGISFVRVKQIEDATLLKLKKNSNLKIYKKRLPIIGQ